MTNLNLIFENFKTEIITTACLFFILICTSIFLIIKVITIKNLVSKNNLILENKDKEISTLNIDISNLKNEITNLKNTIDTHQKNEIESTKIISELRTTTNHQNSEIETLQQKLTNSNQAFANLQNEYNSLTVKFSSLSVEHSQTEKLEERLNKSLEHVKNELQLQSNKFLTQNAQDLKKQNCESLTTILNPLDKRIKEFKEEIQKTREDSLKQSTSLNTHIKDLLTAQNELSQQALNLTNALKNNKKHQGMWGELILEKVLESSGLRNHFEFSREVACKDDENNIKRPDAIVYLPNNKELIIDAKCSLNDYVQFCNSEDNKDQENALKRLTEALKNHIDTLSDRKYPQLNKFNSPNLVFMFVPAEGPLIAALNQDPNIISYALKKHVALTTPSTLLSSLTIAKELWDLEESNKHSKELIKKIEKIYNKLCLFLESFTKVGSSIEKANLAFTQATKQLCAGTGNLVSLGSSLNDQLHSTKIIPSQLLNFANIQSIALKAPESNKIELYTNENETESETNIDAQ